MMQTLQNEIQRWLFDAGLFIRDELKKEIIVQTKTGRNDLVTNVDKAVEKMLVERIHELDPNAKILGEEGMGDQVQNTEGRVFVVDPIDGTMNFVKQRENFAIMIAVYDNGVGTIGYIYDVMRDLVYWGGPGLGVHCNGEAMTPPPDTTLAEGLVGMNGYFLPKNKFNVQEVAFRSSGPRIIGSAGIEFIQLLKGNEIAYISHLAPWDFAAGKILAETLGLIVSQVNGMPLELLAANDVVVATPEAYLEIMSILES